MLRPSFDVQLRGGIVGMLTSVISGLTAWRRLQRPLRRRARNCRKIEPGAAYDQDLGCGGFFEAHRASLRIELDHAVALRVIDQ